MNLLWYRCYRFGVVGWGGVIVVCLCVFCGMLILWCCCFAVVLGVGVVCGFDLVVSGAGWMVLCIGCLGCAWCCFWVLKFVVGCRFALLGLGF